MNPYLGVIGRKVTGGVSGGSIFVSDTFTGTNGTDLKDHTGEIGATWIRVTGYAGVFKIIGNTIKGDSNAMALYYATGTPDTNEYDVEVDFHVVSSVDFPGIGGRVDLTTGDGYWAVLQTDQVSWYLVSRVSGSDTLLGTYVDPAPAGSDRHLKLEIRNLTKKLFINDVQRISSADNGITNVGKVAVRVINSDWGFGSTGRTLDNLVATNAS